MQRLCEPLFVCVSDYDADPYNHYYLNVSKGAFMSQTVNYYHFLISPYSYLGINEFNAKRWSEYLGMPLNLTPKHFPTDQSLGAQMVLAAGGAEGNKEAGQFVNALLTAVWAEEKDIADEATLIAAAESVGLSGADLLAEAKDDQWVKAYAKTTEQAIATGVFGSPTYQVGDELYWGQDRIQFLDRALSKA